MKNHLAYFAILALIIFPSTYGQSQHYSEIYTSDRGISKHLGVIDGNDIFIRVNSVRNEVAHLNSEEFRDVIIETRNQGEVIETFELNNQGPKLMPKILGEKILVPSYKLLDNKYEVSLFEINGDLEVIDKTVLLEVQMSKKDRDYFDKYGFMTAWFDVNEYGAVFYEYNQSKGVATKASYWFESGTVSTSSLPLELKMHPLARGTEAIIDNDLNLFFIYQFSSITTAFYPKEKPIFLWFVDDKSEIKVIEHQHEDNAYRWFHFFTGTDGHIQVAATWLHPGKRGNGIQLKGYAFFSIEKDSRELVHESNIELKEKLNDRALWSKQDYKRVYEKPGYDDNSRLQIIREVLIHDGNYLIISSGHKPNGVGDYIISEFEPIDFQLKWITKTRNRYLPTSRSGGTGEYDAATLFCINDGLLFLFYMDNWPYKKKGFAGDPVGAHQNNKFKDKNVNITSWVSIVDLESQKIVTKPLVNEILDPNKLNDDVMVIPACRTDEDGITLLFQQSKHWKDNSEYQEVYLPFELF